MSRDGRLPFVDLLRAVGAQAIVWHHLAFYGPLSDIAYPLAPMTIDALYEYARMAVQIFFVVGGLMTARTFSLRTDVRVADAGRLLWQRYLRLGIPYVVTLTIAIGANALARRFMVHSSISAPPTWASLGAHLVLLHGILGHEALTAGIWYLAIDLQLLALVLLIAIVVQATYRRVLGRSAAPIAAVRLAMWGVALLSLFWLNRDARLDNYAPYFFGSYFAGMLVAWLIAGRVCGWEVALYLAALLASLGVDWRPRLLVAGTTAVLLVAAWRFALLGRWPSGRLTHYLGRRSYSLFLVHFPVCLVVNAIWSSFDPTPASALLGIVTAWALSLGAAHLFYRTIERPVLRLRFGALARSGAPLRPTRR